MNRTCATPDCNNRPIHYVGKGSVGFCEDCHKLRGATPSSQRRADARYYYRKWTTDALQHKRVRLLNRLIALEEVLKERNAGVLSPRQMLTLRLWAQQTI